MAEKRYIHDRVILLLLSISTFLVLLGSLLIALRLGGRNNGYIVQYRANLGISAFKTGSAWQLLSFIGFMLVVLVVNTMLSIRAYNIRREYATTILGMGLLLIVMAIVVSNALLVT